MGMKDVVVLFPFKQMMLRACCFQKSHNFVAVEQSLKFRFGIQILCVNQGPISWGDKNVLDRKTYQFCIPRPNCNVCVDGETGLPYIPLSSFRDTSRVSKNSSQFWHYLAKDSVRFRFSCHLCFWPTSYKSEVPVTPSFGSINSPEWFIELRKPFIYSITSYYKRM